MTDTTSLMRSQLLDVFGERDVAQRADAIRRTYTEDVQLLDPDEVVTGYEALDAKIQGLLDGAPGFVFSVIGEIYSVQDMGYLTWGFGPEGAPPVVRGSDTSFVRDGRIAKTYTILFA
jgi:hypothetical protein